MTSLNVARGGTRDASAMLAPRALQSTCDGTTAPSAAAGRRLIVVGASGSEGLQQMIALVAALPADFGAAVLLVLHRPSDRSSQLPEVLGRRSRLPVRLARHGAPFAPAACYLGAPAEHLAIGPGVTADLTADHRFRNRTVDLLFETAAEHCGSAAIGVVLAGSLADGSRGLAAIRRAGGLGLVLAPDQTGHGGMPNAALRAVPDAEVLQSPEQIALRLVELVGQAGGVAAHGRRLASDRSGR